MKRHSVYITLAISIFLSSAYADDAAKPKTAPKFTLEDQHTDSHTLTFPRKLPLVLSIADPGGAKDAPVWTDAIKGKYGDTIEFWSMANLQFIPSAARAPARVGIRASSDDIVLCDWDGAVAASFGAEKGMAHIIVISHTGEILRHASGKAEKAKINEVFEIINTAIETAQEDKRNE